MDTLWTAEQVANVLNCKPSSVYSWAKEGKIPAFKLNGCLRFNSKEIEEWIESNRLRPTNTDRKAKQILSSTREVDINAILRKAIDSSKGSDIISEKGKPDLNRAQEKGGKNGAL